jgi:uncharacterized protein YeaO (DUF488 family)
MFGRSPPRVAPAFRSGNLRPRSTKPVSPISTCRNSARQRKAAKRRAGDRDTLQRIYETHIKKAEPQTALGELAGLIKSGKRAALLCYCRDPQTCHRSRIVANLRGRVRLKVEDLIPPLF